MIMGHVCTRNCAFCDVDFGRPEALNPHEPASIAASVEQLGLKYVVMTCVDRDDLADSGAAHWVATIEAIRARRGELVLITGAADCQSAYRPEAYTTNSTTSDSEVERPISGQAVRSPIHSPPVTSLAQALRSSPATSKATKRRSHQ